MLKARSPMVSLIIPVKNEGDHIRNTLKSALQVKTDYSFEIIVVDDASVDGCCDFISNFIGSVPIMLIRSIGLGVAGARNIGAANSTGKYLIFCDAHLFFEDYWIDRLLEPIVNGVADGTTPGIADTASPLQIGYGQTLDEKLSIVWQVDKHSPFPTAVMPGGCCALSKRVFVEIGGFDHGFKVWGLEDVELSMKMWLFGYTCYVQPAVTILHVFRKATPYEANISHVYYNMLRMSFSHFKEERIDKCRKIIEAHSDILQIESAVKFSGVSRQREKYISRRKHNDDWFMDKFSIPF